MGERFAIQNHTLGSCCSSDLTSHNVQDANHKSIPAEWLAVSSCKPDTTHVLRSSVTNVARRQMPNSTPNSITQYMRHVQDHDQTLWEERPRLLAPLKHQTLAIQSLSSKLAVAMCCHTTASAQVTRVGRRHTTITSSRLLLKALDILHRTGHMPGTERKYCPRSCPSVKVCSEHQQQDCTMS